MPAQMGVDKYGIPLRGNNGAWSARKWAGLNWQLNYEELAASVALGGWPRDKWAEAVATAAAESGRNPFIYNTYKKGHFGLFQISRSAHPAFFEPNGDGMAWVNPAENAKEGYRIYKAQGWGAWEAHSKGLHLAFLAQARAAVTKLNSGGTGTAYWQTRFRMATREKIFAAAAAGNPGGLQDIAGGAIGDAIEGGANATAEGVVDSGLAVANAVKGMTDVIGGFFEALTTPAFWMRVAYGTTGAVLIAGGLFLMVKNTAVSGAVKKISKAVPTGGTS